jgi:alpha-glucuronidase
MKYPNFLLAVIAVFFLGFTGPGLRIDGKKDYQIVIPVQAELMEHKAAQQLQYYLYRMSGVNLPVVMEREYSGNRGIYIGRTDYASTLEVDFDFLEEDGYAYRRQGDNLVIAGGSRKGVLYGVYDLLESLGFRKYTSSVMHIPKGNSIALPQNDTVVIPGITYRSTLYRDTGTPDILTGIS